MIAKSIKIYYIVISIKIFTAVSPADNGGISNGQLQQYFPADKNRAAHS